MISMYYLTNIGRSKEDIARKRATVSKKFFKIDTRFGKAISLYRKRLTDFSTKSLCCKNTLQHLKNMKKYENARVENDGAGDAAARRFPAGAAPKMLPRWTAGPGENRRADGTALAKNRRFWEKYARGAENRPVPAERTPAGAGRAGVLPPLPLKRRAAFPGKRRTAARCLFAGGRRKK